MSISGGPLVETQCLHEIRRLIRGLAEMSEWAQRVLADVLQERRNSHTGLPNVPFRLAGCEQPLPPPPGGPAALRNEGRL